jgi:hypothetical protein
MMAAGKPTKAQIEAARKAAEAHAAQSKEHPGAVLGVDPDVWESRVVPSDLNADSRRYVERKLASRGFATAESLGVDGACVSGDNAATVWLMPAEVYATTHAEIRRQRAERERERHGVAGAQAHATTTRRAR